MLVYSEFRKSNFYPLKLDLRISRLVLLVLLVLLVFWYFVKLGFHFSGDLATEKVRSKCQNDPWGRAQLSR